MLHSISSRSLAFALVLVSAPLAFAQNANRITSIVLYPGSATVERTAKVAQGADRLVIPGLPANFDTQTVRVESDAGIRVGEVSTQDVGRAQAAGAREADLEAKIQALQEQKALLDVDAKSAELVRDYLSRLGSPDGDKLHPLPVDAKGLPSVIEAIRNGGSEAYGQIQRVELKKRDLDRQIAALQRDLARIKGGAKDQRTIVIRLAAERAGEVRVRYQVNGAGWRPAYRGSLDSVSSKVELERQATVSQNTGEDWSEVRLRLSTGQPRSALQGPEPRPWQLSVRPPIQPRSAVAGTANMLMSAPAPAPAPPQRAREEADAVVELQTTFATEFEVPGRVSLPSDGSKIIVSLSKQSLPVVQRVRVAPRLDTAAMVTAEAARPEGVWPQGEMQLYRDGNFIGSTRLNTQAAERLVLPFGRDDLVRVAVARVKDHWGETGVLQRRNERQVADTYTLTSAHKAPVDLLVLESSPVSTSDQIEVKTTFTPKPKVENWEQRQGVVAWQQTLAPGESLKLEVDYTVSYSKELSIIGLP
jgi:uncharacterized protein (TIGR02231 family)